MVVALAAEHEVEMPIASQVLAVLEGQPASEMLHRFMGRPPKAEGA